MILIDKLCYHSKLRYVNAEEKFAFAMLTLFACILSKSPAITLPVLVLTGFLTIQKGGVPFLTYIKLMTVPAVFLLLSTLAVFINISKTPLDGFAFAAGSYYITGSIRGIRQGIRLIFTALSSVSCLYFLSLSTPVTDILNTLKKLHFPALILELMLLIYRFIFVMLHLASDITVSLHSRLGNHSPAAAGKSFVFMAGSVFILSVRRSSALYDALEARCYDGTLRILSETLPAKRIEILSIAVFEIFLYLAAAALKMSGGIEL
ncbi:MAG: cobalt ECF transporter T component CbiQ [Dorea sp.]|nr:cobalt ECF transporter T component CbiQ [Dorea sp.]